MENKAIQEDARNGVAAAGYVLVFGAALFVVMSFYLVSTLLSPVSLEGYAVPQHYDCPTASC